MSSAFKSSAHLALHQHGKSRVRVARVWRLPSGKHEFVEWQVATMLESDMERAFTDGDNTGMTATDTQKNLVYYVAKRMDKPCTIEEYAIALARYLVAKYPRVSRAKVAVEQAPWQRYVSSFSSSSSSSSQPHDHCYVASASEVRTVTVIADRATGSVNVTAGARDLKILKTTQSGYDGFLKDEHTALRDSADRMMATSVTATWRYSPSIVAQGGRATSDDPFARSLSAFDYDAAYSAARTGLLDAAFGAPQGGVFSPSVQYTLFEMAGLAMRRCPAIESVFLNMPNLHFLPAKIEGLPPHNAFDNDVFVATSEPHGNIEAVVTRKQLQGGGGGMPPHVSKL